MGSQNIAQTEEIYGPKAAAGLFDLPNTEFFLRSSSVEAVQSVGKDLEETRRKKFDKQTSFGHEQARDGISFGKEEKYVTVVIYSDVQKLNDPQCYVTLPGDYPVIKLFTSYETTPKMADVLLLHDVQTSLDQTLEDEIRRRNGEGRHKFVELSEGESLIQAIPGGAFIPKGNPSNTPPSSADLVVAVLAEANTPPATWSLQTKGVSGDTDTENTAPIAVAAEGAPASTGGTERDIKQDLPQDIPPGLNNDGKVVDFAAYEAWAQTSHQTRSMTHREGVNINHAKDKTHEIDDGREY